MWLKNTNALHIHIPKCGGMALRKYFEHEEIETKEVHRSLRNHISHNPERVKKAFVFTTVRNIYEQLVSMWCYYKRKDASTINMSLESFYLDYKERNIPIKACKQVEKLTPLDKVNYICFLPRINEDIKQVCQLIGIEHKGDVTVFNTTNHRDYREYMTGKFIDFVRREYKEEIREFGYSPNDPCSFKINNKIKFI